MLLFLGNSKPTHSAGRGRLLRLRYAQVILRVHDFNGAILILVVNSMLCDDGQARKIIFEQNLRVYFKNK